MTSQYKTQRNDYEQIVLGAMLLHEGNGCDKFFKLQTADFHDEVNALIFNYANTLRLCGSPCDIISIADLCKRNGGRGDKLLEYMTDIVVSTPNHLKLNEYIDALIRFDS